MKNLKFLTALFALSLVAHAESFDPEVSPLKDDAVATALASVEKVRKFPMKDAEGFYQIKIIESADHEVSGDYNNNIRLIAVVPDSAGIDFNIFQLPGFYASVTKVSVANKKIVVHAKRFLPRGADEEFKNVTIEATYKDETNAFYDVLPYKLKEI